MDIRRRLKIFIIIQYKGKRLYADLGAEKVFAASKGTQKIVVEIKVFGSPSPIHASSILMTSKLTMPSLP
ncbi:MAG: element excision factor XisH family protein [Chloroflexota bacterium]